MLLAGSGARRPWSVAAPADVRMGRRDGRKAGASDDLNGQRVADGAPLSGMPVIRERRRAAAHSDADARSAHPWRSGAGGYLPGAGLGSHNALRAARCRQRVPAPPPAPAPPAAGRDATKQQRRPRIASGRRDGHAVASGFALARLQRSVRSSGSIGREARAGRVCRDAIRRAMIPRLRPPRPSAPFPVSGPSSSASEPCDRA